MSPELRNDYGDAYLHKSKSKLYFILTDRILISTRIQSGMQVIRHIKEYTITKVS